MHHQFVAAAVTTAPSTVDVESARRRSKRKPEDLSGHQNAPLSRGRVQKTPSVSATNNLCVTVKKIIARHIRTALSRLPASWQCKPGPPPLALLPAVTLGKITVGSEHRARGHNWTSRGNFERVATTGIKLPRGQGRHITSGSAWKIGSRQHHPKPRAASTRVPACSNLFNVGSLSCTCNASDALEDTVGDGQATLAATPEATCGCRHHPS